MGYKETEKLEKMASDLRKVKERTPVISKQESCPLVSGRYITITTDGETKQIIELPRYGEVLVISHGDQIRYETTVKGKVE